MNKIYGNIPFSEQREIDRKAYSNYYKDCFYDDSEDNYTTKLSSPTKESPLTFNSWYGTELYLKYIKTFLRKHKIKEINKKADI
jgi:hypothetical protein